MHLKNTTRVKTELIQYYRWLRQYGYNDSHSGNASVRTANDIWITASGACADTIKPDDLIACGLESAPEPTASLDTPLHLAVYHTNPKLNAVLHSHGPYTVAVTLNGKDFEPVDFEGQYYFNKIHVLEIAYENYLTEAPQAVATVLATQPIVVVRGHGVYAAAKNLNLAYKWTCSLELSAKTALLAQQFGR